MGIACGTEGEVTMPLGLDVSSWPTLGVRTSPHRSDGPTCDVRLDFEDRKSLSLMLQNTPKWSRI